MEPRYYSATVGADGQVMLPPAHMSTTYSAVTSFHAHLLAEKPLTLPPQPPKYENRVLLDLASIADLDEAGWRRLLHDDPVLHMVFQMGRHYADKPDVDTDVGQLLAVAELYVAAFHDDELMTLPERMRLQEIEDILDRRSVSGDGCK